MDLVSHEKLQFADGGHQPEFELVGTACAHAKFGEALSGGGGFDAGGNLTLVFVGGAEKDAAGFERIGAHLEQHVAVDLFDGEFTIKDLDLLGWLSFGEFFKVLGIEGVGGGIA